MWTKMNKAGKATIINQKRRDFNNVEIPFFYLFSVKMGGAHRILIKDRGSIVTTQSFTSVTIQLGNVTFELKEAHSFDWIHKCGHVFCVFDEQDSGNIAFGVEQEGRKRFIKYAGARTMEYSGEPEAAIGRLKAAIPLYTALKHPNLIELLEHFEVQGGGYAAIFDWFEGVCLHSHWSFPPPAKYHDPRSPFYRHRHLSMQQRLNSLDDISEVSYMISLPIERRFVTSTFIGDLLLSMISENNSGERYDPNRQRNTN